MSVCSSRENGSLRIKSLGMFNKAMLSKWHWRFPSKDKSLGKRVISSKYGVEEGDWSSREGRDVYGMGLWKQIKKEAAEWWELCQFSLGDVRCALEPLKITFPNLYIMADCWDLEGVAGGWNLIFLKSFNDWELDQVYSLLNALLSSRVQLEVHDRLVWEVSKDGLFSVKLYYNVLEINRVELFPSKMVWNSCIPKKVSFFLRKPGGERF